MKDLKGKLRRLAAKAIKLIAPILADAIAKEVKRKVGGPSEPTSATKAPK